MTAVALELAPRNGVSLRVTVSDPPPQAGLEVRVTAPGGTAQTLAQAASQAGVHEIDLSAHVIAPGRHQVEVDLVAAGQVVATGTALTLRERFLDARLATSVDQRVSTAQDPWAHHWDGQTLRATAFFDGDWELEPKRSRELEETAEADLLEVCANYSRDDGLTCWWAWREGTSICARATLAPRIGRVDLGTELVAVLEPALMTQDGACEVYAVLGDDADVASRLVRVVFPAPDEELNTRDGAVSWERRLPGPIVGGRAGLGSDPDSPLRAVVVVDQEATGVVAHRLAVSANGEPSDWERAEVKDARLVPGQGDVHMGADRTDAAWLTIADGGLKVAKMWWKAGSAKTDLVPAADQLPDALVEGVVRYGLLPGRRTLAWALWTGSQVVHSESWRAPFTPARSPALPLRLLPLATLWLGLEVQPAGGVPEFVPLSPTAEQG